MLMTGLLSWKRSYTVFDNGFRGSLYECGIVKELSLLSEQI